MAGMTQEEIDNYVDVAKEDPESLTEISRGKLGLSRILELYMECWGKPYFYDPELKSYKIPHIDKYVIVDIVTSIYKKIDKLDAYKRVAIIKIISSIDQRWGIKIQSN